MKNLHMRNLLLGLCLVFGLTGCLKDTQLYPVEPRIFNPSIRVIALPDTAATPFWNVEISFDYEDGDGDLGGDASLNVDEDTLNFEAADQRALPAGFTFPLVTFCSPNNTAAAGDRALVCVPVFNVGTKAVDSTFTAAASFSRASVEQQITLGTLPNLSSDSRVPSVSGRITYTIQNQRILPYDLNATAQNIAFEVRIRDYAGHWSNTLTVSGRLQ
jgi:hypothetical protein